MVPATEQNFGCPFTVTEADYAEKRYYVTPGCYVWVRDVESSESGHVGSFHDPCMSVLDCTAAATVRDLKLSQLTAQTRLPFDPRGTGSRDVLGTWPIRFHARNSTAGSARLLDIAKNLTEWRLENSVPWRLSPEFAEKVFSGGGFRAKVPNPFFLL